MGFLLYRYGTISSFGFQYDTPRAVVCVVEFAVGGCQSRTSDLTQMERKRRGDVIEILCWIYPGSLYVRSVEFSDGYGSDFAVDVKKN